ncbi:MAG: helicase associated domain-containing protein [Rikenellaceae bacterium]|nr:helicase associated domain-containing protein [Rikenellaceae bacterium]
MYQDAEAYAREYGSLRNISHSYRGESGGVLCVWVSRQRVAKKNGRISEKQIQMLLLWHFKFGDFIRLRILGACRSATAAHAGRHKTRTTASIIIEAGWRSHVRNGRWKRAGRK